MLLECKKTYLFFSSPAEYLNLSWVVLLSTLISFFTRGTQSPPRIFARPQMLDSCMYFVPCWTMQRHQLAHWCACLRTLWEVAGAPAEKPGRGRGNRGCTQKGPESVSSNIRGRSMFQLGIYHVCLIFTRRVWSLIDVGSFTSEAERINVTVTEIHAFNIYANVYTQLLTVVETLYHVLSSNSI